MRCETVVILASEGLALVSVSRQQVRELVRAFLEGSHENIFFLTSDVFCQSFQENVTFWPRRYTTFLNGKKCDDSAGTYTSVAQVPYILRYLKV